jgi:hypothetical protein
LKPRRARLTRALPLLLLSSILFSATFGVVHTHGAPASVPLARASKTARFVRAGDLSGSQTSGSQNAGDCSVCQLHQQLSGGLLYGPVFMPAPPAEHAAVSLVQIPYLSASSAARRGRAPPQTSL